MPLPTSAGAIGEPGARERDGVHDALLRELAARPGGTWVTCAGSSMEPTIRRGERVRVEACTRVRSGEVALFAALRGGHVLHRVVLAVPGTGWFVHIGDAGSGDGPGLAHLSRLVGRAVVPRRRPSLAMRAAAVQRVARAAARVMRWALRRQRA
jgi:Peptidase S24-like